MESLATESLLKWGSLAVFCAQNSLVPIINRLSTTETSASERASTSAVLCSMEALKLMMATVLLFCEHGCSLVDTAEVIYRDALSVPRESLQLAIPCVIYALQNALLQWSSGHMSAAIWMVTAMFSVVLLQKQIKRVQWLAIAVMGAGIAAVELSGAKEQKQGNMGNAAEQNFARGFVMILGACACSGFAGVYTELLFKRGGTSSQPKKKSVWLQNMQLASFSILLTLVSFMMETMFPSQEGELSKSTALANNFFKGFTRKTWMMVANNAGGGLLVAIVIKYADNILRGFASAFATIVCSVISVFVFGFVLPMSFGAGTAMVVGSSLLYGGIFKLPGDWWNSECEICGTSAGYVPVAVDPPPPPPQEPKEQSNDIEMPEVKVAQSSVVGKPEPA